MNDTTREEQFHKGQRVLVDGIWDATGEEPFTGRHVFEAVIEEIIVDPHDGLGYRISDGDASYYVEAKHLKAI